MIPFVGLALRVCDKLHVQDKNTQQLIMRFCKIYEPEKIAKIVDKTQTYVWWENNTKAAFMKAVGEINREERNGQSIAAK